MDLSKKKASALPSQHLTIPQHLALFLSCSSVWYVARNQIEQFKPPDFAELEERSMTSEPPFPSCNCNFEQDAKQGVASPLEILKVLL